MKNQKLSPIWPYSVLIFKAIFSHSRNFTPIGWLLRKKLGFGVWGLGFDFFPLVGVWGLRFGVCDLGLQIWGLGFKIWGLGFEIMEVGVWVLTLFVVLEIAMISLHHYSCFSDLTSHFEIDFRIKISLVGCSEKFWGLGFKNLGFENLGFEKRIPRGPKPPCLNPCCFCTCIQANLLNHTYIWLSLKIGYRYKIGTLI